MKRRVIVFISCCFFLLGILLASVFTSSIAVFDIFFFAAAMTSFLAAALSLRRRMVVAICLWCGLLFFGVWRFIVSLPIDGLDKVWHYNGGTVLLEATVVGEPVNKPKSQSLTLGSLIVRSSGGGGGFPVKGRIVASAERWPEYEYGQRLLVDCRLERPGVIDGFDYGSYLAVQNVYSVCSRPKVQVLGDDDRWSVGVWHHMVSVRKSFRKAVEHGLNEPEAGLFKAFILGDKAVVGDDLNERFRQSGLSHIVAISGTHITLLSGMIFFLLLSIGLSRHRSFYLALPLLVFYVFLAGAPPSAVRAGFMGFLVLLAFHVGRLNRLDHSLVLSAAAMLFINPKLLFFDIGFQLSFAAVLGMIYVYPHLDRGFERFYRNRPHFLGFIFKMLALTLAAQILTAPILFWHFRQISLVAPIANLFAVWIAPFIMGFGLVASALSVIFPSLAQAWFLPADLCLKYLIFIAEFFSGFFWSYWKF